MAVRLTMAISAIKLAGEKKPDLVVLDVNLPRMSGLELRGLAQKKCRAGLVVLTMLKDERISIRH